MHQTKKKHGKFMENYRNNQKTKKKQKKSEKIMKNNAKAKIKKTPNPPRQNPPRLEPDFILRITTPLQGVAHEPSAG